MSDFVFPLSCDGQSFFDTFFLFAIFFPSFEMSPRSVRDEFGMILVNFDSDCPKFPRHGKREFEVDFRFSSPGSSGC